MVARAGLTAEVTRRARSRPDTLADVNRIREALRHNPGLGRLASVRLVGQFGDGMFQAALSGAILFNPERETDPLAIAAGFAVLLLPYSMIGPYAGATLDRWDRRSVLLIANVVRALLTLLAAGGLLAGLGEGPLLLLALAAVGISRFVLSGISAALPNVVEEKWLVPMNSVLATVAAAMAGVGAATSVALIEAVGVGDTGSAVAVAGSALASVVGAVLAAGFARRALGPAGHAPSYGTAATLRAVAAGLRNGAAAVWRAPGVTTAMIGICVHRMVFGADTLLMVLTLRDNSDSAMPSGLVGFSVAIVAVAAGMLVAAVTTPILIPLLGRSRTIVGSIVAATVVQLVLVGSFSHELLLVGGFLLGLAGQTTKLTGDAAIQIDVDDKQRGQVFALQDTVFNTAFVAAIAAAALVVPADGRSHLVVYATVALYVAGLVAIALNARRTQVAAPRAV